MNARAAYFAKQDPRFRSFLLDGRSYGPHGQGLVIANSLSHYDDGLSRELTELVATANLRIRRLTAAGLEIETASLPTPLFERLRETQTLLREII
ncbi:Uncharacterised protein [uncultured Blautia sp.]|nr:Uncharacterised protein [uncultured Blautia sp.]